MCRGICAREADQVLRIPRATPSRHTDLRARDIELCTAGAACAVQTDVLRPKEVFAVLQTAGDGYWDGGLACFFFR
jgi:hypothetical protein